MTELRGGQVLGRFRIERELGRGGMGVIYLAEDTRLGRKVAIKILRQSLAADPGLMDRLTQEARACAMVQHPNVVRVLSLEEIENHIVIEMDYIEGGSLLDCLLVRPIPVPQVVAVAYQILSALIHCHERGIVHRDIKPSNILLDTDGRVYLTDFGIAKAIAGEADLSVLTTATSVLFVGSPRYAPPESWETNDPSPRWDIYSLGVTLYEAISGKALFDGPTPLAIVKQLVSKPALRLREVAPQVSDALGDLVDSMISPDTSKRPQSARAALDLLKGVPEFSSSELESPTIVPVSPRKARRFVSKTRSRKRFAAVRAGRFYVAVWAVLAVLAVAALIWAFLMKPNTPVIARKVEQRQAINSGPATAAEILGFPKHLGPVDCRVFDVFLHESNTRAKAAWMERPDAGGNGNVSFVALPRGLWCLRTIESAGQRSEFEGEWAEYSDDSARLFRHGSVRGSGLWISPQQSMTVTLDFTSSEDGETWGATVTITATDPPVTDSRFLAAIEESPLLLPLIYNELLPRQLPMAERFDRELPCVVDQVVRSPRYSDPSVSIHVDGKLEERPWREYYYDSTGRIGTLWGFPSSAKADIRLFHTAHGLYLGLNAPALAGSSHRLDLVLLTNISVPAHRSAQWKVSYQEEQALDAAKLQDGREVPWSCAWEVASARTDGRWTVCAFIPFDNVDVAGTPSRLDRWRLTCAVVDVTRPDRQRTVSWWGFPDVSQVRHGAVIAFSPDASVQQTYEQAAGK